ncbi:thioredoxin 1 [Rhodococcus sp. PvR044]|jgi:thioredoxin 1|uniref:thioredoxin n=1 Tax=Rhodococcus TaxID=1827 RepID=UPI000BC4A222|nr:MULTISPECIES: thioredoxin [Rhodococcus]MBP1162515.1 thioredoxin 1 [Rhodococcus sp. PvR099]MCZ4555201.1 thioredoxin [Rhodococcus maanshanensis]PTR45228.1 thioredoxin [Rhodococcus sp. OK611]SNX89563.1 thioredoxin [Rhodococcus sp. OK270]
MSLATTTDAAFAADVLSSETPVLVEFTASWCPPCKMVAPVLEQIADEEAGRLAVIALDVDENPGIAREYQVMSMPTMALFIGGDVVTTMVGAKPRAAIMRALEPHLPAA